MKFLLILLLSLPVMADPASDDFDFGFATGVCGVFLAQEEQDKEKNIDFWKELAKSVNITYEVFGDRCRTVAKLHKKRLAKMVDNSI